MLQWENKGWCKGKNHWLIYTTVMTFSYQHYHSSINHAVPGQPCNISTVLRNAVFCQWFFWAKTFIFEWFTEVALPFVTSVGCKHPPYWREKKKPNRGQKKMWWLLKQWQMFWKTLDIVVLILSLIVLCCSVETAVWLGQSFSLPHSRSPLFQHMAVTHHSGGYLFIYFLNHFKQARGPHYKPLWNALGYF